MRQTSLWQVVEYQYLHRWSNTSLRGVLRCLRACPERWSPV